MKRFSEFASKVIDSPTAELENQRPAGMCMVYGCPKYGAISESTLGSTQWFCRWHFGEGPGSWAEITTGLRSGRLGDRLPEHVQELGKDDDPKDPMFWAKRPKSATAVQFLIDGARRDRRLAEILAAHLADGGEHCRSDDAVKALLQIAPAQEVTT